MQKKQTLPFRDLKKQGEWAELVFMARAAALGLNVAKPWGDSNRYDIAVEHRGALWRVQVKCTGYCGEYAYRVLHRNRRKFKPYTAREIELMAVYVIPLDTWYLIPVGAIGRRRSIRLYPHRRGSSGRYEKYREAWSLLWGKTPDAPRGRASQPRQGRHLR